jgi:acyl-CoA synthetase (AMP-forming)/AMP-acid ligase II
VQHSGLSEALRDLCRQHLAAYEVPAEFQFVETLARSPLGKLLKRELRRMVEDGGKGQEPIKEPKASASLNGEKGLR